MYGSIEGQARKTDPGFRPESGTLAARRTIIVLKGKNGVSAVRSWLRPISL